MRARFNIEGVLRSLEDSELNLHIVASRGTKEEKRLQRATELLREYADLLKRIYELLPGGHEQKLRKNLARIYTKRLKAVLADKDCEKIMADELGAIKFEVK